MGLLIREADDPPHMCACLCAHVSARAHHLYWRAWRGFVILPAVRMDGEVCGPPPPHAPGRSTHACRSPRLGCADRSKSRDSLQHTVDRSRMRHVLNGTLPLPPSAVYPVTLAVR
eukprot:scaffold1190_cov393-Prasinococcus_capsulatus_cf.AAC.12